MTGLPTGHRCDCDDHVLVAWEAPHAATTDERLAAFEALAQYVGPAVAGFAVPWDPDLAGAASRLFALARRHGLRLLPVVGLDHPGATDAWRRGELPRSLADLVAAGLQYEFDGIRYAVVGFDAASGVPDVLPSLRAALGAPDAGVRIGWRRSASAFLATPPGFDFAAVWPPYGGGGRAAVGPLLKIGHPLLVADLAKRRAGDGMVAPSVVWSATREADMPASSSRVTDFSPLMFGHGVDTVRRFVRNRQASGIPFWLLRAAFPPSPTVSDAALDMLAQALAEPHRFSATLGTIAGPIPRPERPARIAAVVHLYYPDLWPEIADALARLPEPCDVFVSCPFRLLPAVRRSVVERFASATVFGVQNLGRDVLPFLLWLRAVGPETYTYVLKLHGKKSVHIVDTDQTPFGGGNAWRRAAFGGLVGRRDHARALLRALDTSPQIGLVAPAGQLYDQIEWKCATADLVATVLERLGIDCQVQGRFPAGTMFWARASALARFATIGDSLLDFEREAGQVDGTLHHAYERLFALVAEHDGYRVTDSSALLT